MCTNSNSASPDPCLKKTHVLGTSKKDNCGTKAACFGDLQAQILATSNSDPITAKH